MYPQPASRALQPAPVATSCPESSPSPCAGPHAAAARPDSNVSFDRRNDEASPPAALPVAGPSRGGGRTRGVLPSRALPRKATATRVCRLQTFTNGAGPARGRGAASRADGPVSGGLPAAALAAALSVRRPPNAFGRALRDCCGGQPPGVLQGAWPACVTVRPAMPARTRRNQHSGHGSRHQNAAGSALSAFPGPSGRIDLTISQSACLRPLQAAR